MMIVFCIFWLFSTTSAGPVVLPTTSSATTSSGFRPIDGLIQSVVRKPGLTDTIFPTICPPSCAQFFRAIDQEVNSSLSNKCACACPPENPLYLATEGFCTNRIDDCRQTIRWNSSAATETTVPVVPLFARSVILPDIGLLWEEAKIGVSAAGHVNCSITRVFFENLQHRWKSPSKRNLFDISTFDQRPVIFFRGNEADASSLVGSVIQLKLSCARWMPEEYCIAIRVAGISGTDNMDLPVSPGNDDLQILLVLGLVCFVLATLAVTFVVWNVCWKIKKRKLVSDFQMQFIYHFKQQQEAQKMAALENGLEGGADVDNSQGRDNRRRLFFSAEYLEREMLENPPPMAEQFLHDLRRMVDCARDRIRQRRFVPMLITIPEVSEENHQRKSYAEEEVGSSDSCQESPRSEAKSVDSGRESKEDSDDSGRDDDEQQFDGVNRVSNIVNAFETKLNTRPSQLPVLNYRRPPPPEVPPKPPPASRLPTLIGHPSPRPHSRTLSVANAVEVEEVPPRSGNFKGRSLKERKGYAVFPGDGTINKSLPRRPKRPGFD
ncbi:unnamed protein product [Caenorhabditis auriculariae]|uniref:Shavenoid isoform B-like N-terminal domain-containing protein n=1 Tax=Caenorhabditis auriculariae TaxID=2777116 RepID=A0A8S1HF91_9PELO|nr:unnamed protein product [Caenorhabditis auriculariae]